MLNNSGHINVIFSLRKEIVDCFFNDQSILQQYASDICCSNISMVIWYDVSKLRRHVNKSIDQLFTCTSFSNLLLATKIVFFFHISKPHHIIRNISKNSWFMIW